MGVGQELNIADFKDHVQFDAVASRLKDLEGLNLSSRERRDDSSVGEASERTHIVGVPPEKVSAQFFTQRTIEGDGYILGINPRVLPTLQINHARLDILLLSCARLALPVEVPDRLRESLEHIRALLRQDVVNIVRGAQVRFTSLPGAVDAKQANDIGVVCVEELSTQLAHAKEKKKRMKGTYLAFVR